MMSAGQPQYHHMQPAQPQQGSGRATMVRKREPHAPSKPHSTGSIANLRCSLWFCCSIGVLILRP
eukprot:2544266-Amphidinium_carterae.1